MLPAVLASAEWLERSGREVLTALILGYDVAARIGAGLTARAPTRTVRLRSSGRWRLERGYAG